MRKLLAVVLTVIIGLSLNVAAHADDPRATDFIGPIAFSPEPAISMKVSAQSGIAQVCLREWQWVTSVDGGFWQAHEPEKLVDLIDFRSLPQMSVRGGDPQGYGLFIYDAPTAGLDSRMCFSSDLERQLTSGERSLFKTFMGHQTELTAGSTITDAVWESLTSRADPTGETGPKPLTVSLRHPVVLELKGYGTLRTERLSQAGPQANTIAVFRADYERNRALVGTPNSYVLDDLRKWTGYTMRELGITDVADLLPPQYVNDGFLPPRTTFTDNFNRADNDDMSAGGGALNWVEDASDWDIVGNEARNTVTNSNAVARANDSLSTDDHFNEITLVSITGDGFGGPIIRKIASSTLTYYLCHLLATSEAVQVYRVVSGAFTLIGTTSVTVTPPVTIRCEARADNTILAYMDGAEQVRVTNETTITGNLQFGMRGFTVIDWDDLTASDLERRHVFTSN